MIHNFDLLSVGIAAAGIALLGGIIYFNDTKSITNKTFLLFSIVTAIWGISNYSEYQFRTIESILLALRFHIFISTFHALFFFQLAYVFPKSDKTLPKWYTLVIVPVVFVTAMLALTSFVFPGIDHLAPPGQVTNPNRGPGLIMFSFVAFGLLFSGLGVLLKKTIKSTGIERRQFILVFIGMFLTVVLIVLFNIVLPVTFNNLGFIPLAALFLLPFIALTSYSIYKYRLFNLRLAATAFISFLVTVFSFTNIIYSSTTSAKSINAAAFLIILLGCIELIRSLLRELRQREALQIANEGQENLIHIMNHQIKGYLGKARSIFAELRDEPEYCAAEAAIPMIKEGFKSATEGVEFIQQVLNSSNAQKGTLNYEMKPLDFKSLVNQVAEEQKSSAKEKHLSFEVHAEDGDFKINGDELQLKEAIKNLIDNSIRYTQKGGLTIGLSKTHHLVKLEVVDTGVGITKDDMPKLFTKGGKGKDSLKYNVNSTGYGLAFVKGVIEAHNGKVWAASEGKNKGSQFYLELPLAK